MNPKRVRLSLPLSMGEANEEDRAPIVAEVSTTRPTPLFVQAPIREPVSVTIVQAADICIPSVPVEEIAARSTEVGGATTPTFSGGCDTQEEIPAMSSCPSATTSFGAIFHQDADGAWRDPLDQRYERIEPSQPGEKERYIPVSIVEDCMRDIDKIVWQLDARDLDKPFDINNREVRNPTRVGPEARPKQSPIWKLNPTTFIIPSRTAQAIDIETIQESVLLVSKASTSDKGKAPLEPIVLVDLDLGKKHRGQKTMDANSRWIDGVGHVMYEPIGDY